ncbi:hypothetical protein [Sideroxydans lithotrophicus]|uniref:Uncharacterized protein n=1 Tax=Sideroxydans lithotrophicus (strain ES-1) TaxID=580332 RepID=D5CTY8_SIDLE|nr:hypothetical protein [Sideroxydans lithotrophicus]ADE12300.1 hypothetical protein Slit_2072 [Sideroxydans lithotrophicus ES-1]
MNFEYLIIPGVVIVGLGGGLFLIKESRKYRLRRDKAKAIQLHQELSSLRKAMEEADDGLLSAQADIP